MYNELLYTLLCPECQGCLYSHNCAEYCDKAKYILKRLNEKIEKYRWHDLRKNPDDLPPEELFFKSLLCVNDQGYYLTDCDLHYSEDAGWFESESDGVYITNVIAWREIEPFEEDNNVRKRL